MPHAAIAAIFVNLETDANEKNANSKKCFIV